MGDPLVGLFYNAKEPTKVTKGIGDIKVISLFMQVVFYTSLSL
jgi:hypothetical protein